MRSNLTNLPVSLLVSDPWEFGTECGVGPFLGTVTDASTESLVVGLTTPIVYKGRTLRCAVARPRHVGDEARSVAVKPLFANIILTTVAVSTVMDVTPEATKDGVVVIGTLERL